MVVFLRYKGRPCFFETNINGIPNCVTVATNFHATTTTSIERFVVGFIGKISTTSFGEVGHNRVVTIGGDESLSFLLSEQ